MKIWSMVSPRQDLKPQTCDFPSCPWGVQATDGILQKKEQAAAESAAGGQKKKKVTAAQLRVQKGALHGGYSNVEQSH